MATLKTRLPDARVTPRFAGICTFCRFPLLESVPIESRPVDWVVYGAPFDTGVTYRPGARFGPRAIREASQYVKPYSIEQDVNICERLSLADGGDAPVQPFALKETLDAIAEHAVGLSVRAANGSGSGKLMAVGGDHSIAYANIKATWTRLGRPAGGVPLIHFDSHLDTVDSVWGEKWSHASVFIRAIEEGLVDPKRMLSIGVKGPLNSKADLEYAMSHGVTLVTASAYRDHGVRDIDAFLARLGNDGAYVTFDIDCVDPAFAPGTGTPSVGGFTSQEVLSLIRRLGWRGGRRTGMNVLGADVVEVLPDRDPTGITSFLAAHVIFELLCLDAMAR